MNNEKIIWDLLKKEGFNDYGIAGLMGNIEAESNGNSNNLQNIGNKNLGVSDEEFTHALNTGQYTKEKFINDGYGYGLCQWTYYSRKEAFYNYMKQNYSSFDNINGQVEYMLWELRTGFKSCYDTLKKATSIREASEVILKKYEMPADQSEKMILKRTAYGGAIYDKYSELSSSSINRIQKITELLEEALKLAKGV